MKYKIKQEIINFFAWYFSTFKNTNISNESILSRTIFMVIFDTYLYIEFLHYLLFGTFFYLLWTSIIFFTLVIYFMTVNYTKEKIWNQIIERANYSYTTKQKFIYILITILPFIVVLISIMYNEYFRK